MVTQQLQLVARGCVRFLFSTAGAGTASSASSACSLVDTTVPTKDQWIGLRGSLQESLLFNGKIYGFRLRFSLKPIH